MRLVLDEDVSWRIAVELRARGYADATSAHDMGVAGKRVKDPEWLAKLAAEPDPCILVTFDNKMPRVHAAEIARLGSTLAVINSKSDRGGRNREEYTREVIHRWAHRMAVQRPATRRSYNRNGSENIT